MAATGPCFIGLVLVGKTVSEGYGTFLMWVLAGRWSPLREGLWRFHPSPVLV